MEDGWTINEENQLINPDGEVFAPDGEPIVVKNAKTQADIDKTVNERLAREKSNHEKLKAAAETVPNLQKMVDESAAKIRELEAQSETIKAQAEQESSAQINKYRQEAERLKAERDEIAANSLRFEVQTAILGQAGSDFNDPATDVVPHLLNVHKREPVKDADGKATGEYRDFFKLRVKNDADEEVEEYLPIDKAVSVWAESHPHHVKASSASGSGGGNYAPNTTNYKRSQMTSAQKAEFVGNHGMEAYQALAE